MSNDQKGGLSRRQWLKVVGTGTTAAFLAACGAGGAPAAQQTAAPAATGGEPSGPGAATTAVPAAASGGLEQGDLKVYVCCYGPPEVELRNKFNADFEQQHAGVKVNMELLPAGQNYFEKLQTLIAAGTPPDVFDMWEGYVQPYAANGALLNLDPLLQTDSKVTKEDILPPALVAGGYQDSVYAFLIGYMPGPVSVYFNTAHLEEAGLEMPTADWTWNDLRDMARELTADTNGDGTAERWGLVFANWFVPWGYWIWSNGGDFFNQDETKSALNDPKAIEAVKFWADLVNVDKVALPPSMAASMQGEMNVFTTGAASMYLGNTWDVGPLKEATDVTWQAVLSPKANDGNRTWYMHTWCWALSAQTEKPNAGWAYARDFVLNRTIEPATPTIPPLKSLLPTFDKPENEELGYGPLSSIVLEEGRFRIPGTGARWDKISGQLLQPEMDQLMAGSKSAEDAMGDAAAAIDEELARDEGAGAAHRPDCDCD